MQATHANHVATLLVVRVGIEQVVAHILEDRLDRLACHFRDGGIGIGGGGHVHQPLAGDDLSGQQRRAPTEAGGEGNLGALYVHQCIQQQLVARSIEIATPVERPFRNGELFSQLAFVRCPHPRDQRVHLLVRWQHVGEYGQQLVAIVDDFLVLHFEVHDPEKFSVGARICHQRLAASVGNDTGHRHPVVGMAAQDGVYPRHPAGHLEVDIHPVVTEQDNDVGALGTHLVDHLLHVVFLDAEAPVGHQIARVGDWRVGKGLANDGARNAIDFPHDIRLEHRVAKVIGLDVLGNEVNLALKVLFNDFLHAFHSEREFPVTRHHIHAEQFCSVHHVLSVGPEGRTGPLPCVAAVQQQGAWTAGLHALDQRRQV